MEPSYTATKGPAHRALRQIALRRARNKDDADTAEASVLELQRQAGNRAVTALLGGERGIHVQRVITYKPEDLEVGRSVLGRGVAQVAPDTYGRIINSLRDYHKETDLRRRLLLADQITGLCDFWLAHHPGSDQREATQRRIIEGLQPDAFREAGNIRAQLAYEESLEKKPAEGGFAGLSSAARYTALGPARKVQQGELPAAGTVPFAGTGAEAVELVSEYGLTSAELAAIRVYTVQDYIYINPSLSSTEKTSAAPEKGRAVKRGGATKVGGGATVGGHRALNANVKKVGQKIKDAKDPKIKSGDPKAMAAEGAVHGSVMLTALKKVKPFDGRLYRGFRCRPEEFKQWYFDGAVLSRQQFDSATKNEAVAQDYANGEGGDLTPAADQTVSVMCEIHVKSARDISKLSAAMKKEDEVVILPDVKFFVTSIQDHGKGPVGSSAAPATEWHTVVMVEM